MDASSPATPIPVVAWIALTAIGVPMLAVVSNWRTSVNRRWGNDADRLHAGLNARAQTELLSLQNAIARQLGGSGDFNPLTYVEPLEPFVEKAKLCADVIKKRDIIHSTVATYRRLAIPATIALAAFLGGTTGRVLEGFGLIHFEWWPVACNASIATGVVLGLYTYVHRTFLENRLASAEEKADVSEHPF